MYHVVIKDSKVKYGPFGTIKECNWWIEREIEAQIELFPTEQYNCSNEMNPIVNYSIVKKK